MLSITISWPVMFLNSPKLGAVYVSHITILCEERSDSLSCLIENKTAVKILYLVKEI
jgi:hypothetical protein